MKALIDGDVVVYRVGFAAQSNLYTVKQPDGAIIAQFSKKRDIPENLKNFNVEHQVVPEDISYALHSCKKLIMSILESTNASDYEIYLTGDRQFRKELYSQYKANRDPLHKPVHKDAITKYLINVWQAKKVDIIEADDAMSIAQHQAKEPTIICTNDKDLDMVPGWHYNFVTGDKYITYPEEATRWFYVQLLVGDSSDNIPGILGCGYKTAFKWVSGIESELELWQFVQGKLLDAGFTEEDILVNAQLLWMKRTMDDKWTPPTHV